MKTSTRILLLFLSCLQLSILCAQPTPKTISIPRPKDDILMRVVTFPDTVWRSTIDFEALFTEREKHQLDSLMQDFEKRSHIHIAVTTLGSFSTDAKDFEDYTFRLANVWGMEQKNNNSAIFIAISKEFRQMRIHNSLGIQNILSDEETSKIIQGYFIPEFKKGNYFEGTRNGLLELLSFLNNKLNRSGF
ncbi:TPM domain-containing protein [Sphingobacterium sp. SRCM116780]|uniref:TPM domain-containing protein n=1 Tax=Sphingobacterium sp. SRCM116780 TaxID=2907623 RepID=UPI001F2A6746|nr:TPM domain-containing protein [Sphingobacterium sp. SRCM116780]UIR57136.1 TPM domain-containing protein [Sphingobacterium sp. SRCM116780]